MSWQYYNLYKKSDRYTYSKQILIAVISVWAGVMIMFSSSYILLADRMAAQNGAVATTPDTSNTYVAPGMAPATSGQGQ